MDETGEIVEPAIPAFLGKLNVEGRATRLDLANWIVSQDNPLTSRVFVNRIWKILFANGLAPVTEDVGSQGEPPYYPGLIDLLAIQFKKDWDIKNLIKTIVLSQAYKQISAPEENLSKTDPYNHFLTHQNSRRLDAEFIRDNALMISGLLNQKIGGRSIKPYQPEGHYSQLNFPKRTYQDDMNEQQYRRGVYMHWQRTYLHPMLKAFDAPSREESCARRSSSNTPLQALSLLNDPTFVEAAKVFAEKTLEKEMSNSERIQQMFEKATSRPPEKEELQTLTKYFESQLKHYKANPNEIEPLLSAGMYKAHYKSPEMAAYTALARVLLNLHETITVY
jgi:hypothetical protein